MNNMDQLVLILELVFLDHKHGKLEVEKPIKISPELCFVKRPRELAQDNPRGSWPRGNQTP